MLSGCYYNQFNLRACFFGNHQLPQARTRIERHRNTLKSSHAHDSYDSIRLGTPQPMARDKDCRLLCGCVCTFHVLTMSMRGAAGRFSIMRSERINLLARVPRTADPLSQALTILEPDRVQMSIVDYKYLTQYCSR